MVGPTVDAAASPQEADAIEVQGARVGTAVLRRIQVEAVDALKAEIAAVVVVAGIRRLKRSSTAICQRI